MLLRCLSSIVLAKNFYNTLKIVSSPYLIKVHRQYSSTFQTKYVNNLIKKFSSHTIKHGKNEGFVAETNLSKEKIIQSLNFHCNNDASPFYTLPIKTLLQIYKTTQKDKENGFCENRLYYISNKIKCQPSLLSKRIVKRTFLYKLSFEWLENSLTVLLDMNVSGDRILRDLWVLKYHHKTIEERLVRVKNSGIDVLYPWMVRCSEDILNRFIQISQETKSILGEHQSTKVYLAKRLNTSPEVIEDIYVKAPALKTIRVTKAKNFIDFLINEGFEVEEIINKSRIFSASQNTVKQRLERLRKLGLKSINLNVLCRSRKDFQKYCESIETISKDQ